MNEFPLVAVGTESQHLSRRQIRSAVPVAIGQLLSSVPQLAMALSAGDVVRIVGKRELIDGIRSGAYRYMEGAQGHLSGVVDQQGKLVGHVNLQHSALPTVAKAAAVFQLASALTLQYYLQRFDERLTHLTELVKKAREHQAWAQVMRAADEVSIFAEAMRSGEPLTASMRNRLDTEERAVEIVALQELQPVLELRERLRSMHQLLEERVAEQDDENIVIRNVMTLWNTVPGNLRSRVIDTLEEADEAMVHWRIACVAGEVHSTLVGLRALDDEFAGKHAADERSRAVRKAEDYRAVAASIGELLELPSGALTVFNFEGGVTDLLMETRDATDLLQTGSFKVAEKYDIVGGGAVSDMRLIKRDGVVLALRD